MRINEIIASLIPKVRPIGPSQDISAVQKASGTYSTPDQVQLSDESQLLSRLSSQLKLMPEIDEAKVAELRSRIEAGEYNPSAEDIAARMIGMDE